MVFRCDENFYGDTCTVYCKDPTNPEQHFKCDRSGRKVCDLGKSSS